MGRDELERERAQLQDVLNQLESRKLVLEHGSEEYVASLKRRVAHINEKLANRHPS